MLVSSDASLPLSRVAVALSVALGMGCLLGYHFSASGSRESAKSIADLQRSLEEAEQTAREREKEISRQQLLRQDERQGRIHAEQALRLQRQQRCSETGFSFDAIAHIESPFIDRRGTPRQPLLVPAAQAILRFNKQLIQKAHFEELKEFSHVWVLFVFHENTNLGQDPSVKANNKQKKRNNNSNKGVDNNTTTSDGNDASGDLEASFSRNNTQSAPPAKLAKIRPPRLHGRKVGCLSTRSPHRPNEIGLSVCEIVSVGDDHLVLRCVDMVHGTPVLDVKPYIPYDVLPSPYTLPMAVSAAGLPLPVSPLRVPDWVVDSDIPLLPVSFSPSALEFIDEAVANGWLKFVKTREDTIEFISQILRQDVRGVYQGRGQIMDKESNNECDNEADGAVSGGARTYQCRLDEMDIGFVTLQHGIDVVEIRRVQSTQKI